jgi:hypothetical protein
MLTFAALAVAVHALSAIYWSGCTFVAARAQGVEIKGLFASQLGAALLACASGGALWALLQREAAGNVPSVLVAGSVAALAALLVQVVLRSRRVLSNRVAALLLALAAVSMVAWRHV